VPSTGPPGLDKKYRVDTKNWSRHRCLDQDVNPEGFVAWRERALGHLSAARPKRKEKKVQVEEDVARALQEHDRELKTANHG
jgi:hypothetical protein